MRLLAGPTIRHSACLAVKGDPFLWRTNRMKVSTRHLASAAIMALSTLGATALRADDDGADGYRNAYLVTPLVSDLPGAKVMDPNLKNAWGVTFSPAASPFWIADNASGLSTLYDGDGTIVPLVVTIPCPPPLTVGQGSNCPPSPPPTNAAPTGMVWNPTTNPKTAFLVPGTNLPASFIWATED